MAITLDAYRRELVNDIYDRAQNYNLLDEQAFFEIICGILEDNGVISSHRSARQHFRINKPGALAVDGYDPDAFDMDEAINAIVCDDQAPHTLDDLRTTIDATECQKYIDALSRFIVLSMKGTYQEEAEESTDAYDFADYLRNRRNRINRIRLYFVTDRLYTGEKPLQLLTDTYSENSDNGHSIKWEAHVWDINRLMQAATSTRPSENLHISVIPGIQTVKAPDDESGMSTYLMFVTGDRLATWYREYGSKLMEANVRSFLSTRGSVNKGIRHTLVNYPERFVAYNNGLTATATGITINSQNIITRFDNLQIVNGGQTTASIFYSQEESHKKFDNVVVPLKLVVVGEDRARELIPDISRYTNSQNKVTAADLSSNSSFQIQLERQSRALLTPDIPGRGRTHWYYERTRGQYNTDRNRLNAQMRSNFERMNPPRQRIKIIDAPRYLMCWDGRPDVASLGAQKCFVRFARQRERNSQVNNPLDGDYYQRLVCKRILFDSIYKNIKHMTWYRGAYQENITEYALAKYAHDLKRSDQKCDFQYIWQHQAVDNHILGSLLKAAKQANDVLYDKLRPTENISEWAKKPGCWEALQQKKTCLKANPISSEIAPKHALKSKPVANIGGLKSEPINVSFTSSVHNMHSLTNRSYQETLKASNNISQNINWDKLSSFTCEKLLSFARSHKFISPKSERSLLILMGSESGTPNKNALNHLGELAIEKGFDPSLLLPKEPLHASNSKAQSFAVQEIIEPSGQIANIPQEADERRQFLAAISRETWRIIMEWAQRHSILTDPVLVPLARLSRNLPLDEKQTNLLWNFRKQMIDKGFPEGEFGPQP